MGFKEFKEDAKPATMDRATLAESKQAFCIVGTPARQEGEYKGTATVQFLTDIVVLDSRNMRQQTNVFLPGSKFFQNFMEGLKEHPEYKHNLYLHMDGKAYDIDQYDGVCPCKHGTNGQANGKVSRETTEQEPDFFTPDGNAVSLNQAPGTITAKQSRAILTLCLALKKDPPEDDILESFSEAQADKYLLKLRAAQVAPF